MSLVVVKGTVAAQALRLRIGRKTRDFPPEVEVDDTSPDWPVLWEGVRESAKKGATKAQAHREAKAALKAQPNLVRLVEEQRAALAALTRRLDMTNDPLVSPVKDQKASPQPPEPDPVPGSQWVDALVWCRDRHPGATAGDRRDRVAVIDRTDGLYLYGRQIGGLRDSFKVRVDVFEHGANQYVVIRRPGERTIAWPAARQE